MFDHYRSIIIILPYSISEFNQSRDNKIPNNNDQSYLGGFPMRFLESRYRRANIIHQISLRFQIRRIDITPPNCPKFRDFAIYRSSKADDLQTDGKHFESNRNL